MKINPVTTQSYVPLRTYRAEKTSPPPGKKDTVTLSDEGRRLQAQSSAGVSELVNNFMDGAGKDGVVTLDEMQAYTEKYLNKAKDILAETLAQLNIPSDQNITIRTDSEGVVRVDSDLSAEDNERLETALNEHPNFQQTLAKATASQSLLDACEKYSEFAKAYEQNPQAAIAQYGIGTTVSGEYVLQYALGQSSLFFENHSL